MGEMRLLDCLRNSVGRLAASKQKGQHLSARMGKAVRLWSVRAGEHRTVKSAAPSPATPKSIRTRHASDKASALNCAPRRVTYQDGGALASRRSGMLDRSVLSGISEEAWKADTLV